MRLKLKIKTIVVLIAILIISKISLYGFGLKDEIWNNTNDNIIQASLYAGYVISANITNAHGNHGTFGGQPIEATVEGINIEQDWGIGINTRYFLIKNFDIQADLLYSKALFPKQEVKLQGFEISQPKSDLNFFTISIGPGFRYKDEGTWQVLNPYASFYLSVLLGYASDVNLGPVYGVGGNSAVTGIGLSGCLGYNT
jgi:hypothetical protein